MFPHVLVHQVGFKNHFKFFIKKLKIGVFLLFCIIYIESYQELRFKNKKVLDFGKLDHLEEMNIQTNFQKDTCSK